MSDTAMSPTFPSISTDISTSTQPRASSEPPSLADLISSAIDSDVFPPSDSPSPQAAQTSESQTLAELLNSVIATTSKTLLIL